MVAKKQHSATAQHMINGAREQMEEMLGDIRRYLDSALAAGVDVDRVSWRKPQTTKKAPRRMTYASGSVILLTPEAIELAETFEELERQEAVTSNGR
jgi:hypothetical protein